MIGSYTEDRTDPSHWSRCGEKTSFTAGVAGRSAIDSRDRTPYDGEIAPLSSHIR